MGIESDGIGRTAAAALTADCDRWIKSVLGIDVSPYRQEAEAMPGAIHLVKEGQTVTNPAPVALNPALKNWFVAGDRAQGALADAMHRSVMPGPALDAQRHIGIAIVEITDALQSARIDQANDLFARAMADMKLVNDVPDAAMGPVVPGSHPDQVVMGEAQHTPGHIEDLGRDFAKQNNLGDCYLISVLGDIATLKPEIISKMVQDNKNGTYTVTFHKPKTGLSGLFALLARTEAFEPVAVTVDGNFGSNVVNTGGGEAFGAGNKHEVWAEIVEKAYAKLHGGYDKIDHGGWAKDTIQEVTGKAAIQKPFNQVTASELQADFDAKRPVIFDTIKPKQGMVLPKGMFGPHAYALGGITMLPEGAQVTLKNPWGKNDVTVMLADLNGLVWQVEKEAAP